MNRVMKALQDAAKAVTKAIWEVVKFVAKVLINYTPTPHVMVIDTCEPICVDTCEPICVANIPYEVQEHIELTPQEYVNLSTTQRWAYNDYMTRKYEHEEKMLKLAMRGGCS